MKMAICGKSLECSGNHDKKAVENARDGIVILKLRYKGGVPLFYFFHDHQTPGDNRIWQGSRRRYRSAWKPVWSEVKNPPSIPASLEQQQRSVLRGAIRPEKRTHRYARPHFLSARAQPMASPREASESERELGEQARRRPSKPASEIIFPQVITSARSAALEFSSWSDVFGRLRGLG